MKREEPGWKCACHHFHEASVLAIGIAVCAMYVLGPQAAFAGSSTEPSRVSRSPGAERNAFAAFRLKPGFRIELVASEPLVVAPVAAAFDEHGRIFVVERREGASGFDKIGRVRVLDDCDAEGIPQTATVLADELPQPSAVACYGGGVFVGVTPEVVYLKSSKGDDAADQTKTVLAGFGDTKSPGPTALLNNFNWGLDNRFHGAVAGAGGVVNNSNGPDNPVSIRGGDFSFDPRTLSIRAETGPSQSGLAFDSLGRKFSSDLTRPLRLAMYEARYVSRNPMFPRAPEIINLISPAEPVYRFDSAPAAAEGGEATSSFTPAWFTNAQGLVIYQGTVFPSNFWGNAFVPDSSGHAIHRAILRESGLGMLAERAIEEKKVEFLNSSDPWFRPIQVLNGPDGGLYIVDRADGRDRGRIFRVLPAGFQRPKPVDLSKATTYELVAALASPEAWRRDTAARLLFEHRDATAVPLLAKMLSGARSPIARVRALYALDGLEALKEEQVITALRDTDARVREHAVRLSEKLASGGTISDGLWNALRPLAADAAIRVRCQLAYSVGEFRRPDRLALLAEIIGRDPAVAWIQTAVLSSLADNAGSLFTILAGNARFAGSPAGLDFLRRLAIMIGAQGHLGDVMEAAALSSRPTMDRTQAFTLLAALGDGLYRTRSSLALVDNQHSLQPVFLEATAVAINGVVEPMRTEAVRLLGVSPVNFSEVGDWLLLICSPQPLAGLQSAAIGTLCRFQDPRVFPGLLDRWRGLPPSARNQAINGFLGLRSRVPAVLDAIAAGRIPRTDLTTPQMDFLRSFPDPRVSERAVRVLGPVTVRRPAAVEQFRPALQLKGKVGHGREIFLARCSGCHQSNGLGQPFGPDLTGIGSIGKERIQGAILEPSVEVQPEYTTTIVDAKDDENLVGIKVYETVPSVTLRQPGGTQLVWPRLNLAGERTETWSLMPAGLEQGLSTQDMADLVAYLSTPPWLAASARP